MELNTNDEARVSNLDYLTEMSNGNEAFVEEMIGIFLVEMPTEILNLEEGILRQDHDTIRQAAHKLKSTVPFVGLDRLLNKDLCEIEDLAAAKEDMHRIIPLFNRVKNLCERAAGELKAA